MLNWFNLIYFMNQHSHQVTFFSNDAKDLSVFVILLHPYPGFYSYTEGATWKILDLLTETLLI